MSLPDMTPAQLLTGAQEIAEHTPDAVLVKNKVGNLAIIRDGEYTGWLNLRDGTVSWFGDNDDQAPDTGGAA